MKSKSATIVVQAADSAKGSGKAQVTVSLSPQAGAPTIEILSPAEGAPATAQPLLILKSASGSGVDTLSYSVDSGAFTDVASSGGLAAVLSSLGSGVHSLSVKAKGLGGLESLVLKRSFKVSGGKPGAQLSFQSGKDPAQPYLQGMTLVVNNTKLMGTATAPNGIASVIVNVAGADQKPALKKISATESSFELPLPANLPFARSEISVTVQDVLGLSTVEKAFFHRITPPATSRQEEGIYVLDSRLVSDGPPKSLRLGGKTLFARFVGRPIASLSFQPDVGAVAALSFDGRMISLAPGSDGISAPTKVVVKTVDGDTFEWGPVTLIVDGGDPEIELSSPLDDQWLRDQIPVSLRASDPNGIASLAWSLDGTDWKDITVPSGGKSDFSIPMADKADGAITLYVRAADKAGRASVAARTFNKDTQSPSGGVTCPRKEDIVNGYITIGAAFADSGGSLEKLEFSTNGTAWEPFPRSFAASRDIEMSTVGNDPANIRFKSTDKSGNSVIATPLGVVDGRTDLPVVRIQLPMENEVLRADFEISGVVTDDDGVAAVYYKIDEQPVTKIELNGEYSFNVPVQLLNTTDNEHKVEIQAEDIFGVKGDKVVRPYRISKEEPVATMSNPPIENTVKGVVVIEGTASDANGIARVALSVDNSLSFNLCDGDVSWKYRLDTRALEDGLHSIYVKPVDKYDTDGFFATLMNIDNTPPTITLDQPRDGSEVSGSIQISGRVFDSLAMKTVKMEFARILTASGAAPASAGGKTSMEVEFGLEQIITRSIDISELEEGVYNLRIRVTDRADNQALATRTVTVVRKRKTDTVDLMFPLKGETISGEFSMNGVVRSEKPIPEAALFIDGAQVATVEIDENGYFNYQFKPEEVADGNHVLSARIASSSGEEVKSADVPVVYKRNGPWISIETFQYGDYLPNRPYMKGRVGWYDDNLDSLDKASKAKIAKDRKVAAVDISFDNGKSFQPAKGTLRWTYRLETQDYREGALYLIMRATFADGTKTYVKTVFNLDKTAPRITLLAPVENERLNERISMFGTASDETKLGEIKVQLRPGDKAGYKVPSFIQGLFFDGHAMGATNWEAGAGLTFFDDNVKLMGFYGQGPTGDEERFGGTVYGAKLLANIYYFPFSYVLGPDWEWLSANLALGTCFTYFTRTASGNPLTLASVLAQLEFPILTIPKITVLRRYSAYTEFQVWLISSDVSGGIKPKMSFGLRANIF
jgi:hypothetical protein